MERMIKSDGQIALPQELFESLHVKPGDSLEFEPQSDGSWRIRRRSRSVKSLKGILGYTGPPVSLEDMERAIIDSAGR